MAKGGAAAAARPRRHIWGATGILVGVVAAAGLVVMLVSGGGTPPSDPPIPADRAVGEPAVSVCGFADMDPITAAAETVPDSVFERVVEGLATNDERRFQTFAVGGDTLAVLWANYDAEAMVSVYSLAGEPRGEFTADFGAVEGQEVFLTRSLAVGDDGSIYLADINGGDNAVVQFSADGERIWATGLEHLQRGKISGLFRWHDDSGATAVGVTFGEDEAAALVSPGGDVIDDELPVDGALLMSQPNGTLHGVTWSDDGGSYVHVYDENGDERRRFGSSGDLGDHSPTGGPTMLGDVSGTAPAPDGGTFVVATGQGITLVDGNGIRQGVAADGTMNPEATYWLIQGTPLIAVDDRYLVAADFGGGEITIASITGENLLSLVREPVKFNAAQGAWQAELGFGAGLVTDMPLNYFPPGAQPEVTAVFDPWWSSIADSLELHYTVRRDPRLAPDEPETRTTDIPVGDGRPGEVQLELPAARPGPYQVHAELVDAASGETLSSTCLNYSVGGPDSELDFSTLADGADWGGAHPLRGVQLAAQLGIGSHRWQLDFASIVPDPDAEPTTDALNWESLPGQEPNEDGTSAGPFEEIAAAAELAEQTGVKFVLQIASGGENENRAVQNGSWGAWVRAIVSTLTEQAPELRYWADWNEPNNTGFNDGAAYTRDVLEPFAAAVREVDPNAVLLGGNTLGTVPDWWDQALSAGACEQLDVLSVHPYTGHNQPWEEAGMTGPDGEMARLTDVLAPCVEQGRPIWNTESGWWSDGPANFWAQADDVTRAYLWMRSRNIDDWTYFFSEGGFGETGNSWSLIQYADYVKPGALAFMTTSALMRGRPDPSPVDLGIPFSHAMRIGANGSGGALLAAWTDEMDAPALLSTDADESVEVTVHDVYGATTTVTVPTGGTAEVRLSGSPQFFQTPAGVETDLAPVQEFGPNLLLDGTATASSTAEGYPPEAALKAEATSTDLWMSGPRGDDDKPDLEPWLQVELDDPITVDRIAVATRSIRCCTGGLRDYTVSVRSGGEWTVVAEQSDQFFARTVLFDFPAVEIDAVRIDVPSRTESGVRVMDVNYSGAAGGLHPAWWTLQAESEQIAAVSTVAAYAPEGE